MSNEPIEILLVEDSPGDAELVREGLRHGALPKKLNVVLDGVEAMEYLRDPGNPIPDLILLDINLPRKNGHEVLKEMRSDLALRLVPVIVLTTSEHDVDVLQAYEEQANAYVQKPLGANDFIKVVQEIEGFWLSIVRLPPQGG